MNHFFDILVPSTYFELIMRLICGSEWLIDSQFFMLLLRYNKPTHSWLIGMSHFKTAAGMSKEMLLNRRMWCLVYARKDCSIIFRLNTYIQSRSSPGIPSLSKQIGRSHRHPLDKSWWTTPSIRSERNCCVALSFRSPPVARARASKHVSFIQLQLTIS